jgi:hypothetical protein
MTDLFLILILSAFFIIFVTIVIKEDNQIYDDPIIKKLSSDLQKIYPNFNKLNIIILGANDSFTENKKKIFICFKKPSGEYYSYHTLLYITIHELAHVLTAVYDNHGEQFQKKFQDLLIRAKELDLYDETKKIDYDFCGTKKSSHQN